VLLHGVVQQVQPGGLRGVAQPGVFPEVGEVHQKLELGLERMDEDE